MKVIELGRVGRDRAAQGAGRRSVAPFLRRSGHRSAISPALFASQSYSVKPSQTNLTLFEGGDKGKPDMFLRVTQNCLPEAYYNVAKTTEGVLGLPSRARFVMAEYKVQFDVFEGPLDLLLYLIKKEEVDIYEVNLTRLATQFIEYIEVMRLLDLEIAGEFLVMASTLMYIKSRELLPKDLQVQNEEEDEGEDPRWELIRQLVAYKKFKDAAVQLQVREISQENIFPRLPVRQEISIERAAPKQEASIFDLINAINDVLKRISKRDDLREIFEDKWTVSEKIEHLVKLMGEKTAVTFAELFSDAASRSEVVCTFLALLELIRLKQLVCVQAEDFGTIEITRAPVVAAPALTDAAPETPAGS
ncbi:MAG TPA: segregation/condensation protein A [Candidatus Saccharimonadales bacterium]|nr:segregation/condensation protein A [Candidatus Saccharimonadales bacterium]